jgi:hypothetical protein
MRSAPAGARVGRGAERARGLAARGAFAAALARAGSDPARARGAAMVRAGWTAELARSAAELGQTALARRRRGTEEGHRALEERRSEAEPGGSGGPPSAPAAVAAATGEVRTADTWRAGALWPPAALDALALAARRGDRPSLELSIGREVRVTLVHAARGIEVVLDVRAGLRAAAEAEIPALVAALRARGVAVARAEVRAPPGALTARRGSATTAPSQRDGTVAKW